MGLSQLQSFEQKKLPVQVCMNILAHGIFNVGQTNCFTFLLKNGSILIAKFLTKKNCQYKYVSTHLHMVYITWAKQIALHFCLKMGLSQLQSCDQLKIASSICINILALAYATLGKYITLHFCLKMGLS